ncbi:hypothetical protein RSAG8_08129, partial [Rhizoctonia solani AG-8 WAC10335]
MDFGRNEYGIPGGIMTGWQRTGGVRVHIWMIRRSISSPLFATFHSPKCVSSTPSSSPVWSSDRAWGSPY